MSIRPEASYLAFHPTLNSWLQMIVYFDFEICTINIAKLWIVILYFINDSYS